jgi:hypothetical protein
MVTPPSLAKTSGAGGARVSGDGRYVAFRASSEMLENVQVSGKDEAYMFEVETGRLEKVSSLGTVCDTDAIYAKLLQIHTEQLLQDLSLTSVSTSSCNYFAAQGFIPSASTNGVAVGAFNQYGRITKHNPSMSDSGRFLSFTTNFDAADTRGTHEAKSLIASNAHLFLFDADLGMTWQLTSEGVAGAEYEQLIEEFCCPSASSSQQRGACSEKDEMLGLCCWQKPCFSPAVNSELSGDGNSIVFLSDFDHTGAKDTVAKDLEVFHYYIPTSTFTRITKTDSEEYNIVSPTVSFAGDRVAWGSDFDWDKSGTPQIFLNELLLGCSGNTAARNYLASPDVETCCTWNEGIEPHTAGAAVATVILTFALDQSAMIERVPFKTAAEVDRAAFCGRVAEQAKSDVACALDIPPSLITVGTGGAACGWASDFTQAVTVELTLHQLCFGTVTGLASPSDLAAAIVSQHADPSSRLWRGYLTKTLDAEAAPEIMAVAGLAPNSRLVTEEPDCTCECVCAGHPCTTTDAPTDDIGQLGQHQGVSGTESEAGESAPTGTPDDTTKDDQDHVDFDDIDPSASVAKLLPLAVIGFLF